MGITILASDPIRSVREHLLQSSLSLDPNRLQVTLNSGRVSSSSSLENAHFTLHYEISVVIQETQQDIAAICFILLQWLDSYQPSRGDEGFSFSTQNLDNGETQTVCLLKVQNVIMVDSDVSETTLSSVLFPRFDETCPETALEVTVQHHSR